MTRETDMRKMEICNERIDFIAHTRVYVYLNCNCREPTIAVILMFFRATALTL